MKAIFSLTLLVISTLTVYAQDFYLAPNGVTCMCPNAAVGASGDPGNGIVYTKRTRSEITPQNAATTCTSGITDMSTLFYDQSLFNEDISTWDVSSVHTMSVMFAGCELFNQNLNYWDVSNVNDMSAMFYYANSFNQDLSNWDVSNVSNFYHMFGQNQGFNHPSINQWDMSGATTIRDMFRWSVFNQDLNNWNTTNITNMSGVFVYSEFNSDISSWDVSNVTTMHEMFNGNLVFNQNINNWNTSNVQIMSNMFMNTSFNQPLNNWDVSNVVDFSFMFSRSDFNQPLNSWNLASAITLEEMFGASLFNQPIDSWDVSNVISLYNLFNGGQSSAFNQDISSWIFHPNVNLSGILNSSSMSSENYDLLLNSMVSQPLFNKEFGDNGLFYCNISDHDALINDKGWVFDGGLPVVASIVAPNNIMTNVDNGLCVASNVNLGQPSSAGCGTLSVTNNAPSVFPLGFTTVTWTLVDGNGTTVTDTQQVEVIMVADEAGVCYVSADENSPSTNRIFITSDPALNGQNVDFHEVFRESPSGAYETIGFIVPPEDSYLDATSNNNTQAYRYKVRTTDICGQVLAVSDFHKTILLQSSIATDNSVNLAWNPYIGVAFNTYNIYRSVNGGNYELLNSVSSTNTSYNDTSANVVDNFYEYYISIDVASCNTDPFQNFALRSNLEYINPNLSIGENNWLKNAISVYPNPASALINISASEGIEVRSITLYSALGQRIMSEEESNSIDVSTLPSGVYYMAIETDQGRVNKSLVRK